MLAEKIDDALSRTYDHLLIEECRADSLVQRFGSPIYVVSEDQLRRNVSRIRQAFQSHWPLGPVRILASEKASLCLALRRILVSENVGSDTFGPGELYAALVCGVPSEMISVNGTGKNETLIRQAVEANAKITLDSADELELTERIAADLRKVAVVRFRIRPHYDRCSQASELWLGLSVREAADRYKPGIPLELAPDLGKRALASPSVQLSGLMAHLGRHRADCANWAAMATGFADAINRLRDSWDGWLPSEIDVGGGFAAPRDPTSTTGDPAPDIERVGKAVAATLAAELDIKPDDGPPIVLELEPGRSLFADTGVHLASVRHVKLQEEPTTRRWIETDTSEVFLPDLVMEHATFRPVFANKMAQDPIGPADIVGISCTFDVLHSGVSAPTVKTGDVVAFLDTGAYQVGGASNFNAMPRPGVVLVHGDQAEWIKTPETIEDVFGRDIIPGRLA